jgi:tRNA(Ile)-lysidine synthase
MLLQRFKAYIAAHNLLQPKDRLLLAVSGGVDSVVLCELCRQAGYDFIIAHCNFKLRGAESERDEAFVKKLGDTYGVEVVIQQFETTAIAREEKKSVETAARDLRYGWFYQLINESADRPIRHILTAHHADDTIETSVMNFFRGTGIAGIRGILPKQGNIIRPLLFARRKELEDFVTENKLAFVTDSTNFENDYTRNFFRNIVLPQVATVYPDALKNVLNNIQRFTETEQLYQQAIEQHKKKLLEKKGNEFHIPVLKLQQTTPLQTVLYEIIKDFGFSSQQTPDAIALLQSETGKYIQSGTHRIIKNRQWLLITPNETVQAENILIGPGEERISFANGELIVKRMPAARHTLQNSALLAQLDINEIAFPLLLRKWKQGDYFYPLGMKKKKKLSRFFIDQKLSLSEKENTWVVEMNKKIIWVVGLRIDNRFKINTSTQQVLLLQLVKKPGEPAGKRN